MKGTILKVVAERGFGFIRPTDSETDVFFHYSQVEPGVNIAALSTGVAVAFEVRRDAASARDQAVGVRPLGSPTSALAATLHALIVARYPRPDGQTPGGTLRADALKLIEETLETACCVALPCELSPAIDALATEARALFRNRAAWQQEPWASGPLSDAVLALLRAELADVLVCVLDMAHEVTTQSAERGVVWDIETAALNKATADVVRA